MKEIAGKFADGIAGIGLLRVLELADRSADRVRIVAYHRVDEPAAEPDLDPGLISATPTEFRAQAEVVARHYNAISLDDLVAAHRGERKLPSRPVLFTFDDGYLDFANRAWPTLKELGLPAVLFVPTAFPDVPGPGFWWDRLYAALTRTDHQQCVLSDGTRLPLSTPAEKKSAHRFLRTRVKAMPHDEAMAWLDEVIAGLADLPSLHRVLSWDALRSLAREGVSVCSHSHRHALVTRLSPSALADDLRISKARIEDELGADAPAPVFAYPASANNAASRQAVIDAGYTLAFGGGRRIDRIPVSDPAHVTRLPMLRYATSLFRAQLRPSVATLGRILIDGRTKQPA